MSNDEVGHFIARRVAEELGWVDPVAEDEEVKNEQSEVKASRRQNDFPDNNVKGEVLARVGDDLLAACLDKGSEDNMSVLIVALPASGINSSLSVAASNNANVSVVDDTVRELEY